MSRLPRPAKVAQIVRLARRQPAVRLGLLKGKLPERLLEQIARPLTRREVQRLFGTGLEP